MSTPLQQVDANLRAIKAIEGASSLPALPDEVTLDVAGNSNMSPDGVQQLFLALESDIEEVNRTRPMEVRQPDIWTPLGSQYSRGEETGRLIYGLTGSGRVEQYNVDAVQDWKQRAVDLGFLDLSPQEIEDPRWLPEYSSVAVEMLREQAKQEFSGDKPGSMSVDNVMNLVEEWLSPKGLYQAALELDLFWDTAAIGRESAAWGDKWRGWLEEPWNPGRLVDALTGPLDDLIFPVVNWGLMLTGIGEAYIGVRAGLFGAKSVAGLYKGSKGLAYAAKLGKAGQTFLTPADRLADVAHFKNASFMSMALGPRAGAPTGAISAGLDSLRSTRGVSGAHNLMQGWRNLGTTVAAKKVNQQALRLGISSNVEGLVDNERGHSIASMTNIDEKVAAVMSNPVAEWSIDLLIYPPNIFERGAFATTARAAGRLASRTSGFEKLTQSQELTLAWNDAIRQSLEEADPEKAAQYLADVHDYGVQQALANQVAQGSKEKLGEVMAYVTTMAVIDGAARNPEMFGIAEELMSSGQRIQFHKARNRIIGQLREYDPDRVDVVLDGMARYGLNIDDGMTEAAQIGTRSSSPAELEKARNRVRGAYLGEHDNLIAGPVEGDVRLYGMRDPETGEISWASDAIFDENPYFVDVNLAEFNASVDEVQRNASDFAERVAGRYKLSDMRQARVSDADIVGRFDQEKLRGLRDLVGLHNSRRQELLLDLMAKADRSHIQQYVYETSDSFGRFHDFIDANEAIKIAYEGGQLDNVALKGVQGPTGARMNVNPKLAEVNYPRDTWYKEMYELVVQMADDPDLKARLMDSVFSPLLRDIDPGMSRFALAGAETATKQEALEYAAAAKRHLTKVANLNAVLEQEALVTSVTKALDNIPEGESIRQSARRIAAEVGAQLPATMGPKKQKILRAVIRDTLKNNDGGLEGLRRAYQQASSDIVSSEHWGRFGVPEQVGHTAKSTEDIIEQRLKELYQQSMFLAAEVDLSTLPEMAERLKGYKLVYGVEFAGPQDVMQVMFPDLVEKQIRNTRMRAWFGRKDPAHVRKVKQRIVRSSLKAELMAAQQGGGEIRYDVWGDSSEATMDRLVDDLYDALHEVQDSARSRLTAANDEGILSRVATRASLARIPFDLSRLPSDVKYTKFQSLLRQRGYVDDEISAIHRALMRSQALGFNEQGLFAIESLLRSRNNVADGLRLLGRHEAHGNVVQKKMWGGAITGAAIGGAIGVSNEDGAGDGVGGTIVEGVVGAAAGAAGARLLGRATGQLTPRAGALARQADRVQGSGLAKWGYVADNLANMRDLFRFSLSPIFDASRYSEAIILNQIGEMPDGLRNLRVNQSPSGVRKAIARTARANGADANRASAIARAEWDENRRIFAATAAGDMEMETIDSVGRRFSSVGVLGFSPTDWMEATFWHLRQAGVDNRKAYETVREIYTYGMTGRSSAELSMNFVFFPFSFTKKVLTHMQSFFAQDLGRLVLIQDGLATYQTLNDNYDLSSEFRDRLPVLDRMNRMNVLAYGIGPGRFGGVNAPITGALRDTPLVGQLYVGPEIDEITNLFVPQMVTLNTDQDASELWDTMKQLLPAVNDVNTLIGDAIEQGYVIGSESHMTRQAEARRGWEEWRDFQQSLQPVMDGTGKTWGQLMRTPEFNQFVTARRAEISAAYPEWKHAMGDGIARSAAIDLEIQERIRQVELGKGAPEDQALVTFQLNYNALSDLLSSQGYSMSNPEEVPPEAFVIMKELAVDLAQQEPRFKRLYDRMYRRMFGDIATELT